MVQEAAQGWLNRFGTSPEGREPPVAPEDLLAPLRDFTFADACLLRQRNWRKIRLTALSTVLAILHEHGISH